MTCPFFPPGFVVPRPAPPYPTASSESSSRDLVRGNEDLAQTHRSANATVGREGKAKCGARLAFLLHPREVFRGAVIAAASAVVHMHKHPSGEPEPSGADIKFTKELIRAGQILKIEVLDHVIIIGNPNPCLLRELGHFPTDRATVSLYMQGARRQPPHRHLSFSDLSLRRSGRRVADRAGRVARATRFSNTLSRFRVSYLPVRVLVVLNPGLDSGLQGATAG